MNYEWLDGHLSSKNGAVKDYKVEREVARYMISGKMFAVIGGGKAGNPIITLKLDPLRGDMLRGRYKDIIHYMNKTHWNSVYLEGEVPGDDLRDMADESYRHILEGLPKKTQKEISELR